MSNVKTATRSATYSATDSATRSATRSATIVNADRAILIATDKLTKGFDLSHDIYNITDAIENNIYSDILLAINQELLVV